MELSDLRVFQAVVSEGGISSAAAVLNRVPSNITARIKKLEAELKKQLFIRDNNRLRISPAGKQLLNYSVQILAMADEAVEQLNNNKPRGKLRIGSMEAVAASRLPNILMEFHGTFPELELAVHSNPTGTLITQTLSGDVDVALVADPISDPRLEIAPLFSENLILVSHKNHPNIKSALDLGKNPTLIGFSAKCAYRERLNDWIKESYLSAKIIEINSYHALLSCITAGMGVGLIPEILLEQYPFRDGLGIHKLPTHIRASTTCAIWRKDSSQASLLAFIDVLKQAKNDEKAQSICKK